MAPKPVPDGFHTVTSYLLVDGAAKLMEFLAAAFDADEMHRHSLPDGSIMHAQMKVGDSIATHREDVSAEEMERRQQAMAEAGAQAGA